MKRKAILLGTAAAAVLLLLWLRGCFLSEEERVRRIILSMADGFNRSRAGQIVDPLAEGYVEETSRHDRTNVRGYLGVLFLTQRDAKTKEFRYRVEVENLSVTMDAEKPGKAQVVVVASFLAPGCRRLRARLAGGGFGLSRSDRRRLEGHALDPSRVERQTSLLRAITRRGRKAPPISIRRRTP